MKKTCFLLFTILCMLFSAGFSNLTYAFLSDTEPRPNQTGVGHNRSTIEEEFPAPEPIKPHTDQAFPKIVTVKNDQSVPCYIRVFIGNSDCSLGDHLSYLDLNTSDWTFISSAQSSELGGYYYYHAPVLPGTSTVPLFQAIQIDASADLSHYEKNDTFQVIIYEESVQSNGYSDYLDAWNQFLRE